MIPDLLRLRPRPSARTGGLPHLRRAIAGAVLVVIGAGAGAGAGTGAGAVPARVGAAETPTGRVPAVPPTAPPPSGPLTVGAVEWRADVVGEPVGVAVDGDDLVVLAADEVRLLDVRTGALRWRTTTDDAYDARPAVGPTRVAVTGDESVTVLDRADGAVVARTRFPGPGPAAVGRDADGVEVVAVASESARWAGVIDAATGRLRWRARFGAETWVAPGITGGVMVVAGETRRGTLLRAYDLRTGGVRWQVRRGPDSTAPLAVAGTVYFGSGSGRAWPRLEAFVARTGRRRWATRFPGVLGAAIEPARAGDRVFVLDAHGTLGSFRVADGRAEWFQPTGHDVVFARVAAGGGRVAWTTFRDEVVVADAATGALVGAWRPVGVPIDVVWGAGGLVQALRRAGPARVEGLRGP